jgi:hypothetical protein
MDPDNEELSVAMKSVKKVSAANGGIVPDSCEF